MKAVLADDESMDQDNTASRASVEPQAEVVFKRSESAVVRFPSSLVSCSTRVGLNSSRTFPSFM